MKTSELSLLYNSLFKELYKKLPGNYKFNTDENMSGDNVFFNKYEYDSVKSEVEKDRQQRTKTEAEVTEDSKKAQVKTYSEVYEVSLSVNPQEGGLTKEQNYIKNRISSTYARGNSNPYLNLLQEFSNDNFEKEGTNIGDELHLNLEDFIYLRDIGVYPVNRLMILRRFTSAPASPDLVHSRSKTIRMGRPISKVIGWVKGDDDIFNISFNEVWKTQDKWVHDLIKEIINDQFGIDIGNIFPMPGWGQSLVFSFMSRMGWTDYGGSNLPIGDPNLLRTGITRETEGTGLATNMSLKLETTYELKYIQNVDPTTVFYSIINNLLNMGTSNIKFLFKGGSNISNLQDFVSNPNIKNLISLVYGAISDILREVGNIISNIKANKTYKDTLSEQTKVEKNNFSDEDLARKAAAKEVNDENGNFIKTEPVLLTGSIYWSTKDKKELDSIKTANEINNNNKNTENLKNNATTGAKKSGIVDRILNMRSTLVNGSEIVKFITGFLNSILASTIARYEWPMKGAIAQSTGMNMTPWHLTIGNPKAPIISMNYIKVDSVEIKLSGDIFYNDLPRYINATISISNARPLGKQEILKFFGNTFIREYASSVKFVGNLQSIESVEKLMADESTSVYQKTEKYKADSTAEYQKNSKSQK